MRSLDLSELSLINGGCKEVICESTLRWILGFASLGAAMAVSIAYLEPLMTLTVVNGTSIYAPSLWIIFPMPALGAAIGGVIGVGIGYHFSKGN